MPDIRRLALLFITLAAGYQVRAAAQDSDDGQGEPAVAPVVLDGDTLFSVRGVSSFPAERRASRITEAIRDFAADRAASVESLAVEETGLGSVLTGAGKRLMAVVDADGELEGDAGAQRVAEHVHAAQRLCVEGSLDGIGNCGHGGAALEVWRPTDPGEVDVDDVEAGGQRRQDSSEVAAGAAQAVQQQERLAGAGPGER